jgi:hypothetical protein
MIPRRSCLPKAAGRKLSTVRLIVSADRGYNEVVTAGTRGSRQVGLDVMARVSVTLAGKT